MIAPDAKPIAHRPVYRRIDPSYPGRPAIITAIEVLRSGARHPDPAIYRWDVFRDAWILKEDV